MSKTAKIYILGAKTPLNDLNNYSDVLGETYITMSEDGSNFSSTYNNEMISSSLFYDENGNTVWGQHVYEDFNVTQLSSAIQKTFTFDVITPTFPVCHYFDGVSIPSEYPYIILCGKYPIETGDIIFFASANALYNNIRTVSINTAFNMRRFGESSNIGAIYLPISSIPFETSGWSGGANFTTEGYYQYLFINTATPNKNNSRYDIVTNQTILDAFNEFIENSPYTPPDDDPYSQGGNSGGGGGTGDFDDTSDTIGIPSLPSVSGLNTGFFTAFVCTQSQLQNVSNYLWTDVISDILDPNTGLGDKVDALKKMVTSPYDAIMGCSLVPVNPPTGGTKEMKMYGVVKTGINLPYASSRWVEVDCGTLNIHEFWGSYLDYSPYTKTTSLYLPYIGVVSVDIDLIMAKALQVVYHVDILTGICIAYIVVDGSVKFQYQGHCSTSIPVTASDFSGAIQSGLGLVGNIANVVSSGASGGLGGSVGGAILGATKSAISQAPSVASNVMGMKPDIKSGGGVGSSGGILGVQKPFLIIERPKQSVPAFQNGFSGYPCNMTLRLGDLSGYTEVERINLSNISLTEDERAELLSILESGVYL